MTKSPIMISSLRCSGLRFGKGEQGSASYSRSARTVDGGKGEGGGTHLPMKRFLTSAAMRGSISTATHFLTFSRMRTVRLPVPGPTSSTTSVGLRNAWVGVGR